MKHLVASVLVSTFIFSFQVSAYFTNFYTEKAWDGLKVKFAFKLEDGFFPTPRFIWDSLMINYVKVTPEEGFQLPIEFYCYPDDPSFCLMFDKKGQIVGVQMSFLKKDVENIPKDQYDFSQVTNFFETNFFGIPAYSFRVYFTNPEELDDNGRKNVADTAEGLWMYLENKLYKAPMYQPEGQCIGPFYRHPCLTSGGLHYYYKVHKKASCDQLFPFFLLYDNHKLIGFGLSAFGQARVKSRDWYDRPDQQMMDFMFKEKPDCMKDLLNQYGFSSIYVWLVKEQSITCLQYVKELLSL